MTKEHFKVNWQRMGKIGAIAVAATALLSAVPFIYLRLFPAPKVYCVIVRNGEPVKAWNDDCNTPDAVIIK